MAANDIMQLHRGYLPTSAASPLWSPTASTDTMVKNIVLVNHGASAESVQLFIAATGSPGNDATIFKASLNTGESAIFDGILNINAGDEMYGNADTASAVSIVVDGMEMTG